jgi:hypothetical protein
VFFVGVAERVGVRRNWIDLASMATVYMTRPKCPDLYPQRTTCTRPEAVGNAIVFARFPSMEESGIG